MKSRDERRADFERREVERKARYRERMDALRARGEAQKATRDAAKSDATPTLYAPSLLGTVAAAVVPGLAVVQSIKSDRSAKAVRDSMTPEQRVGGSPLPDGSGRRLSGASPGRMHSLPGPALW